MANQYPSAPNTFSNPAGTNTLPGTEASGLPHATQHADLNDAVESHEAVLGTNAGTSVLKHFAAGQFPVRATGVAAIGTLQQTLVGGSVSGLTGTINNPVIGTPAITGGTATAMSIVGTDILPLAGMFGTSSIISVESNTQGTFLNTTYNNGTNVGSIVFTPQVSIRPLIFLQVTWNNGSVDASNTIDLSINGTSEAAGAAGADFILYRPTVAARTVTSFGIHLADSTLGAGTAGTIIARVKQTTAGSVVVFRSEM